MDRKKIGIIAGIFVLAAIAVVSVWWTWDTAKRTPEKLAVTEAAGNKTADSNKDQAENDAKLALMKDAKAYFESIPSEEAIQYEFEPPYGNPQAGEYVIGVQEMNKDTAIVYCGPWQSEGWIFRFKHSPSGKWEYVEEIVLDEVNGEEPSVKVVNTGDKEAMAREMLYAFRPDIKEKLDAGPQIEGSMKNTMCVDIERQEGDAFLFHVYYIVESLDGSEGHTATMEWYRVNPVKGEIWDDMQNELVCSTIP